MSTIRDPAVITSVGRQMMTAGGDITYTKAILYGQDISHLTKEQLAGLTSIGSPLLTVPVGISDKNDVGANTTVVLEATFQNTNLKADLPYTAVGFFAKRGDDAEKLVLVGVANSGAYLVATSPDGVTTDSLDIKVAIAIGDATSVTAVVDPAGSVTPATLNGAINNLSHDITAKLDANQDSTAKKLDTKADKTAVADQLATKANQSDLDKTNAEVLKKADSADVTAQLDTKADKTDVANSVKQLQAGIDSKADKSVVDAEIAKIDFTPYAKSADVTSELQNYTTTVDLNKLLAGKEDAGTSYSKAELDKKLLALSTDTDGKINADQVSSMIANKVDKSDLASDLKAVNDSIATKANSSDVDLALAKKDDVTDVDAKIKTVTDLANTKANSSDVYTKSAVDTAFSQRDSRITNVTNLANQIDSTRLPLYQGSANEDLKGFFTPQIRMYNNATGVKNIPADCQYQSNFYGTLVVLPDGASNTNDGSQILITPERKAWISQSNGQGAKSWSDWSRFTLDSDLIALQNSLQSKIDTKANASDVYKKSEVDGKTSGIIITGYDIASETPTKETNDYTKRLLVDQGVLTQFVEQINQLKGRRTVNQPDFNALTDGGSYYITDPSNGKNAPTGSWGNLFVSNGNGHRISQLYFPDDGSAPFMRELDETTWHGWIQFATAEQINTVNSTLGTKANTTDVNTALNGKANTGDVTALQNRVNVDDNLYSAPGSVTSWASLQADGSKNVLRSVRTEGAGTDFNTGNYDAGILFGGNDTKALISVAYIGNRAIVTGGNNQSVWHEDIAWKSDVTNLQNQVNTKASASDVNSLNQTISALQQTVQSLQNTVNQQATQITGLQTQVSNQAQDIAYIKANYIEGKRFSKANESAADAWEKENSQRLAFITDN